MVRQLVTGVVSSMKVVNFKAFRSICDFVNELNRTYGYKRFTDVALNNIYFISGCGVLIEFQDAKRSMTIISDLGGKVLSCRLKVDEIEAMGISKKLNCSVTPTCLIME